MDQRPILVGHSMGGGIITNAADRAPELFAGLIYPAAFAPLDGDSIVSLAWRGTRPPDLKVGPWRFDSVFSVEDAQRRLLHDCKDSGRWAAKIQRSQCGQNSCGYIPRQSRWIVCEDKASPFVSELQ